MDLVKAEQVAAFRYSLIAPIVSRQTPLAPGELKDYLLQTAQNTYNTPGSKNQVSVRTLERYLAIYRKYGWEGLKPAPRPERKPTAIPAAALDAALAMRRERPERSVEQIIFCLTESGVAEPESIAASTLSRYLKKAGASRSDLMAKNPSGTFRRFEVEDAHLLWQADFQHTLYLPDPKDPKHKKKAMLFAILDDFSRALVHAQFYWDEKLPRLEDSLKKAVLKHGIPAQFYCDNGAVFSSAHLSRICGKLGIHLSHSRPYRPQGRGKIERLFRFVDTSFLPEAYQLIESGSITSLEGLNTAWNAWADGYYHIRKHGSTKATPLERLASCQRPIRKKNFSELTEIFLWEEERKADKTACIKLYGNTYEIDSDLAGQKVLLRYDPFDLTQIQVWLAGKRYTDAKTLDVHRHFHKKVDRIAKNDTSSKEPSSGISLINLALEKRLELLGQQTISFSSLCTPKEEVSNDNS